MNSNRNVPRPRAGAELLGALAVALVGIFIFSQAAIIGGLIVGPLLMFSSWIVYRRGTDRATWAVLLIAGTAVTVGFLGSVFLLGIGPSFAPADAGTTSAPVETASP